MEKQQQALINTINSYSLVQRSGRVISKSGLLIKSQGPAGVGIGEICHIYSNLKNQTGMNRGHITAEVVGLNESQLLLLPYGEVDGLLAGSKVIGSGAGFTVKVGDQLLGRVVNAFCQPIDGGAVLPDMVRRPVRASPTPPLERTCIDQILETGIRAIDSLLTIGYGQRMSILAGSGVGKSTLLGMLVRHSASDVIVVGLIGERGREVLEFIERILGKEGMARSIMVVATADEPALVREAATLTAMTIAEYHRDQNRSVLLIIDSLTRYAMARREVGLAMGEPATSRGYTPSVFSELAGLLERCGTRRQGGSITGLFTVLVEGDDIHDPIADSVRGIVDGHIVLSRELANHGHFPAIDILNSISRLSYNLATSAEQALMKACRQTLSILATNKDLLELGLYQAGSHPALDRALEQKEPLEEFLQQGQEEHTVRDQGCEQLTAILGK